MSSVRIQSGARAKSGRPNRFGLVSAVAIGLSVCLASCSHERVLVDQAAATSSKVHDKPTGHKVAQVKPRVVKKDVASAKSREYQVPLQTVTEVAAYGRGPYICSPSGFGQMSHCVPRATFN